jgi:sphingolipid delta-4 desaturase
MEHHQYQVRFFLSFSLLLFLTLFLPLLFPFQGVENIDVDIPTRHEAIFFTNMIAKFLWMLFQPLFYVFRPLAIKPRSPGLWEAINWTAVLSFDIAFAYLFGAKAIVYLMLSSFFGSGLHPVGGHFIAEHYVFLLHHETYSYYGPLNFLSFFVGYHNEHHDFPRIPGSRLHLLRQIAPEYYDQLPCHNSWVKVNFDYITDPRGMKKREKERKEKKKERATINVSFFS